MISFTQEELQRIADTDHVQCGDASAIARMLLASLNAIPIYQVQYGQQWRDVTKERYEDHRDHGSPTRIVYAEPPAPVEQSPEIIGYEHRMICGELRPVPKFSVEQTHLNILKEELDVNAKLAEYSLNKSQPQPTSESEDRKMLKRLAIIMSGNDAPGEIRSLTVTAQSLVDRCKALAREKENSHIQWKPASPDEINKRSVREPRLQHTDTFPPAKGPQIPLMASSQVVHIALHSPKLPEPSSREAVIAGGVLVQCPRCHGDSYRMNSNGWVHYWCDKCANAITSEGK